MREPAFIDIVFLFFALLEAGFIGMWIERHHEEISKWLDDWVERNRQNDRTG